MTKGNPPKFTTLEDNFAGKDRSRLDWDQWKLNHPNFITYLCPTGVKDQFIVCAENSIFHFEIDQSGNFNHLGNFESHPKVVNMCSMLSQSKILTCSRDPVIKLYDLANKNFGSLISDFTGHEMTVNSIASSPN